jgi:hypothetical protein
MRRWAALFVVAEGEDEDRLLQAYDEEVTIRRTLPQTLQGVAASRPPRKKMRRLNSRLSYALQRNAGLTASL